jgi:hypothetical protein
MERRLREAAALGLASERAYGTGEITNEFFLIVRQPIAIIQRDYCVGARNSRVNSSNGFT